MPKIYAAIACNLDSNILQAALPLLAEGRVQAMEWSFDALFGRAEVPTWFTDLLGAFEREKRLVGHGVFFSLFSGKWLDGQQKWLSQLKKLAEIYRFDHVTEHFGFMTGPDFHAGAPISLPFSNTTLRIGLDRLQRMQAACGCAVGLENLAFAYSLDEVRRHGEFLEKLVEPLNGFIILDLHNFYCQLHNFQADFDELLPLYPLHRVREIHISGGSWDEVDAQKIRRDTHDDSVPAAVFELLERTIDHCPNLKYVVLEQIGTGLADEPSRARFQADFLKMEAIVEQKNQGRAGGRRASFLPKNLPFLGKPIENEALWNEQMQLSQILETAPSLAAAEQLLADSSLAQSDWQIENWRPEMLETARRIAQKWKNGFLS